MNDLFHRLSTNFFSLKADRLVYQQTPEKPAQQPPKAEGGRKLDFGDPEAGVMQFKQKGKLLAKFNMPDIDLSGSGGTDLKKLAGKIQAPPTQPNVIDAGKGAIPKTPPSPGESRTIPDIQTSRGPAPNIKMKPKQDVDISIPDKSA